MSSTLSSKNCIKKRSLVKLIASVFQILTINLLKYFLFGQSERLHNVLDFVSVIHDLCAVLGMDFFSTITEVHPSLDDSIGVQSKSISDNTLSMLSRTILSLKEDKKSRLKKVFLVNCRIRYLILVYLDSSFSPLKIFVFGAV